MCHEVLTDLNAVIARLKITLDFVLEEPKSAQSLTLMPD